MIVPKEPPADYRGLRVGDRTELNGMPYIVMALIPNFEHKCERGWACKARWKNLLAPATYAK